MHLDYLKTIFTIKRNHADKLAESMSDPIYKNRYESRADAYGEIIQEIENLFEAELGQQQDNQLPLMNE